VSTEVSAREPAQRSSRAESRDRGKEACEKDVENRGNELNNSFGINKIVKKRAQNELISHAEKSK